MTVENNHGTFVSICKRCNLPQSVIINQSIPDCPKKQKQSIGGMIYNKIKPKPATVEEINQLKLDYEKAKLKAGIKKFKGGTRPGFFTTQSQQQVHKRKTKKKKQRHHRGRNMEIDDTEEHKFDGLIGRRKALFW